MFAIGVPQSTEFAFDVGELDDGERPRAGWNGIKFAGQTKKTALDRADHSVNMESSVPGYQWNHITNFQ
ncbi:unnamed protein product [Nezara viridula]|uniref:Uncharacterized protein n=1 Tax=Nezara viridula TaxID=85310 RepID=A0A9P0MZA7_NEZVI|nr:unnamed protein product [Nezara viridula]